MGDEDEMGKTKTHEEFIKEIKLRYGDKYKILSTYINAKTKILVRHNCEKCNFHEWEVTPDNLLRGKGCPICKGIKIEKKLKKTNEEFIKEIKDKYSDEYTILEDYINSQIKILVRHNKCGYNWKITPNSLLRGRGCPVCGNKKRILTKRKIHDEFVQEVKEKYGDEYIILGKYINSKTKILVKHNCKKCNYHKWEITPNSLLQGYGCPVCAGRATKLGVNTMWDTDRWMVDLGVGEEDAKKYTHSSSKKIVVKCPDCGKEKKTKPYVIYNNKSISCLCGDGKSYPEKFVVNVLEQLDVDFETEYKPKWIKNKRYDFYIKDNICIIETHGGQHYDKGFDRIGGRTLEREQINDKFKRDIALQNGIKHYIELDCRESNLDYIKNSILNSELSQLFDLSKIDWNKCAEFANKNIVKKVCDDWNNRREDETTVGISKKFKLSKNTIQTYLKKGTKLGWCDYDPKEEIKKARLKGTGKMRKARSRKVEIIKKGKSLGVFESCLELERQSEKLFGIKLCRSSISLVCNNKLKQYKDYQFKYIENVA